ncbi:MSC_0882 family membrane protein [Mycoplasmopsis alligatoris]|uniref:Uncharacterized protein n=1 Tax=Mycoplasmopsis alligatoris A21JP2 TaxID=747682 RepID=D4XWF2_9BACT|nr:hypothetical protein [Mycoplasmopsis alligatoris]EFF41333.1 hypothetical protein MALL_0478 [Mycoplasmopsis alligatoris A21JP2]
MQFNPIKDTQGINVIQNSSLDRTINNESMLKSDPLGQLSPRAYKIIRREKVIKGITSLVWGALLFTTLLTILILYLVFSEIIKIPFGTEYIDKTVNGNVIGYYILLALISFIAFYFMARNLIDFVSWKNTVKRLRDSYSRGDSSANVMFHTTYRKMSLKTVKVMWIFINILTFYGFFTLVVFGLKYLKINTESDIFALKLNMELILQKAFGNVNVFTIINVIALVAITGVYIFASVIDKKRISDLQDFLGEKTHEIMEGVAVSKEKLNKALLKVYLICVGIFIVLPIFIAILAVFRIIKRKKAK